MIDYIGQHWKTTSAKTNPVKKWGEGFEEMKVNSPERSKLGQGRNAWQWAKHTWLYSDLSPEALKGEQFVSSRVLNRGNLKLCVHCTLYGMTLTNPKTLPVEEKL